MPEKSPIVAIKEARTLQVTLAHEGQEKTVTFRFDDAKERVNKAEISVDGVNWISVDLLHKAIGVFIDRFPLDFAE